MSCKIASYRRVVIVVWGKPQLTDVPRVVSAVKAAHDKFGPVVFIARMPSWSEPPPEAVQKEISRNTPAFLDSCVSQHIVFEGEGFASAAKRLALAGIIFVTARRVGHFVHAKVEEVAERVPAVAKADVEVAMQQFRTDGLLDRYIEGLTPEQFIQDERFAFRRPR